MNQNVDQFEELNSIRRQRRNRTYVICFTMFAMISVMNMLSVSQQATYQTHSSTIFDSLEKKTFQQLIQYLQLYQPEYELGVQSIIDYEFINKINQQNNADGEIQIQDGENQLSLINNNNNQQFDNNKIKEIETNYDQNQSYNQQNNNKDNKNNDLENKKQDTKIVKVIKLTKEQQKQLEKARLQFTNSTKDNEFFQKNKDIMSKEEQLSYHEALQHMKMQQITLKSIVRHLFRLLNNKSLEGQWNFTDENNQTQKFLDFENSGGLGSGQVYFFSLDAEKIKFNLQFSDGQYIDQKRLYTESEIKQNSKIYHKTATSTISIKNSVIYQIYNKTEQSTTKSQQECDIDMNINFGIKQQNNRLKIDFTSEKCGINIGLVLFELNHSSYWKQALVYALLITALAVTNIIGAVKTLKNIIQNPQDAPKYSIASIVFIFIWDGFFSGTHLIFSISEYGAFQYLMPAAVLFMILWLVFERTLMIEIWKIQNQAEIQNETNFKKKLMWFHGKIYGLMLIFIVLGRMYIYEDWFMISINTYLIFQIITNAIRGQQSKPDNNFIWMLLVPRSLIPLYIKGCPYNIYKLHPSAISFFAILFLLGIQIGIIYAQQYYGTRFFIPDMLLPQQFNYFENMPQNLDIEAGIDEEFTQECTICFMALHMDPGVDLNQQNSQDTPYFRRLKKKKNQIMRTPCNHRFHIACLANWMNIKMECPTCRANLPPL